MSHHWMILSIAPCLLVAASPADAATPFSKLVPADAKGRVQVSNVSGDITITAWDRREVDVQGEYGEGIERIDVTQDGGDVQVKVIYKDRGWLDRNGRRDSEVRLQVRVPVDAELEASTVSGSIVVQGARGEQRLKSVSGDVRADIAGTEVNATTVSGSVELTGTGRQTQVRASSVSGDVRLRRMGGEIEVRSTSGNVDVEADAATELHGSVVSGSVSLLGTLAPEAEVDVSAVSGRLRLTAQAPAGFRYDITTFSGNVRNCFGAEPESEGNRRNWNPGTRLTGKRGEGRASIRARSHSGNVELCDR